MAAIYSWCARVVERWPETISGYNTMSPERKKSVDIAAMGRFCARLLYVSAGLSLLGTVAALLRFLPEQWRETTVLGSILLPVPLLLAGAVWGWWRYDKGFLKRFRR